MGKQASYSVSQAALHSVRQWERQNLPLYGKDVGYLLFLELAKYGGITSDKLKSFYLSMPYAESTVRLLLRQLEADGWVQTSQVPHDKRSRQIELTPKFLEKQEEWLEAVQDILRQT